MEDVSNNTYSIPQLQNYMFVIMWMFTSRVYLEKPLKKELLSVSPYFHKK